MLVSADVKGEGRSGGWSHDANEQVENGERGCDVIGLGFDVDVDVRVFAVIGCGSAAGMRDDEMRIVNVIVGAVVTTSSPSCGKEGSDCHWKPQVGCGLA